MRRTEKMKIIEMLRLSEIGMSQREIAASAGCGKSTIGDVLRLCKDNGITHETASKLTDDELHEALYPKAPPQSPTTPKPDWQAIHEELAKHKNLNLQFLWEEYRGANPNGLSYSRFCAHYREYRKVTDRQVSLYQERKAGELMEVDWMGDTLPCVIDGETGERIEAHFFVAILGYSHYPYVEAFPNEQEPAWITAHVNALRYYGGVPRMIVPDNCRTAVKTPKYYEPTINSAYWELAQHYQVAILPARSRKPKDKPAVEKSVGWLETWLLGKLRNQVFFSFAELNKTVLKSMRELSSRPFQKREGSRYSEFIGIDSPALRPLPTHKYEIADIISKKVGDNYHLEYAGFYYSVPYTLHGETVILRATGTTIEIIDKNHIRMASHERRYIAAKGRYVTCEEHMPPNHKAVHQYRQFDGARYRSWARKIGENTLFIIDSLLAPEQSRNKATNPVWAFFSFQKRLVKHGWKQPVNAPENWVPIHTQPSKISLRMAPRAPVPVHQRQPPSMKIFATASITVRGCGFMLNHQTVEKLNAMKLPAMAAEYIRQLELSAMSGLDFDERVGMMADAEWLSRENKRVQKFMKEANLRFSTACFADIDYRPSRKLDRSYIARLSDFAWVKDARNMILTGCTGTGKTWLACAFGAEACRKGLRVSFYRVNRLLNEMATAAASGSVNKLLAKLKRADILILDDWGLTTLNPLEGRFLLEIFEDRYSEQSTILSAQLPVTKWHGLFDDATVADAVLDRVVHNSHRLELHGHSLRPLADHIKTHTAPLGAQDQNTHSQDDQTFAGSEEGGEHHA